MVSLPTSATAVTPADGPSVAPVGGDAEARSENDAPHLSPDDLRGIWKHRGGATLILDVLIVLAAFLVAYFIRFHLRFSERAAEFLGLEFSAAPGFSVYLQGALLLAALWVGFIRYSGGYESGLAGAASPFLRGREIFYASFKAIIALMALSYLFPTLRLSRPVFALTWLLALAIILMVRLLFREIDRDLSDRGVALQRVAVAGLDAQALEFARRLAQSRSTVRVIGFVRTPADAAAPDNAHVLGPLEDIASVRQETPFDKLVFSANALGNSDDPAAAARLIEAVNYCEAAGVTLYSLPNVMSVAVTASEVGAFSGMAVIRLRDAALHSGYAAVKRIMDLCIAATTLIAGAPLWIAIALLVKFSGKGPVLFTQTRIGLHGRPFRIYKFRSMVIDAEERLKTLVDFDKLDVPGFKIKGDPRVTMIGRFLRRTSLDEIPQLFNVLKGEMSCIGPRPELPDLVARYNPWQRRRLKAKPGITGYQQVMARGVPLAAAIELDLIYLKHQSLLLDLYILFRTVGVVLFGSGVTH